jgi:hypothetical protein
VEKEADGTANIAFFGLVIVAFSVVGIVVAMKLTSNAPADGVKRGAPQTGQGCFLTPLTIFSP